MESHPPKHLRCLKWTPDVPPTNAPHLTHEAREVLEASKDERVYFALQDHWLGYTKATEALAAMRSLLERPRTTTSPSILLLGRSGNGKSTILKRFATQFEPTIRTTGDLTRPLVSMEMPPRAAEREFWSEMLIACGCAHRVTDPAAILKSQAYAVLRTLQPRVLICDELHNVLLSPGINQRLIMAHIRELTNKLQIHVVLAGTEIAQQAADADDQISRRLARRELPKWKLDRDFLRLLRSFEAVMPLPHPSNLASEETAREIEQKTDGTIGSIAYVVSEAAANAIRGGFKKIDLDLIRAVREETRAARQLRALDL